MTVYFIGAGPGDPELITVKGQRLIRSCPVIIYAGSLVPAAVLVERTAVGGVVAATAGVVAVPAASEKAKGAECGLSVLSAKVAVRVKLVTSLINVTVQSMAVAVALVVWQARTPSWYRR